jgi:hypothetical protein
MQPPVSGPGGCGGTGRGCHNHRTQSRHERLLQPPLESYSNSRQPGSSSTLLGTAIFGNAPLTALPTQAEEVLARSPHDEPDDLPQQLLLY